MRIFLTCSKTAFNKYRRLYAAVLNELKKSKVSVEATLDKSFLDKTPELKKVKNLGLREDDYKYVHDTAVRQAIYRCDAIIVEASYPSFRLGFETFFALSLQKPVLVLSKFKNYANLINQPHFFGAKYTDFTLPDEIEKFVKHVKKYKLRSRFNLFISDKQKGYLDEMGKRYGISKSDCLRKLIDKDISSAKLS